MTDRPLALALFAALVAACSPPEPIDDAQLACDLRLGEVPLEVVDTDPLEIRWDAGDVWAVAVTSPGAEIGAWGRVAAGRLYWQVAAAELGGTLAPPLRYGERPDGARDYTVFGGGWLDPLEPGRCYEVQVSDPSHGQFGRLQFRAPGALAADE